MSDLVNPLSITQSEAIANLRQYQAQCLLKIASKNPHPEIQAVLANALSYTIEQSIAWVRDNPESFK